MDDLEVRVRRARYRLSRQGMLELDAWLAALLQADLTDPDVAGAVGSMLEHEPPELQRMMQGERPVPDILKRWLARP